MEAPRRYVPREGVDYLVNLYTVAGLELETDGSVSDMPADELGAAILTQLRLNDPSRLDGMAPDLLEEALTRSKYLHRARAILLDPLKRAEYDEILRNWDRAISKRGEVIIDAERYLQMQATYMESDEIEEAMTGHSKRTADMVGYDPSRLAFLEELIEAAGGNPSDALRAQYEDALLQHDRVLAIDQLQRSSLLGLPPIDNGRWAATLDYARAIEGRITTAREERTEDLRMQALGGVGTRLAIMAGEASSQPEPEGGTVELAVAAVALPAYFEPQAAKVRALAEQRQEITRKRLANFRPNYPAAELQTEYRSRVAMGAGHDVWFGMTINPDEPAVDMELPEDVVQLLLAGDFQAVVDRGFNILTFDLLDHIDLQELLEEVVQKYRDKYEVDRAPELP